MVRTLRILPMFLLAFTLGACATTTTQLATLEPALVEAEQQKQRALAIRTQWDQQARLDSVSYPLLKAAVPLCEGNTALGVGFHFGDIHGIEQRWVHASEQALGLKSTPTVVRVAHGSPAHRAGLQQHDELVKVGTHMVVPGVDAIKKLGAYLTEYRKGDPRDLPIVIRRNGQEQTLTLQPEAVCRYGTWVTNDGALNAYADGNNVIITTTMMRFVEDDELASIVGHEIAHNAMGHLEAKQKNALLGALAGAIGDIALASMGVNSEGYFTSQGLQAGAMTFSQDFEREADYVGLYVMALANQPLENAPRLWRHLAAANPGSIAMASSHPTTAERFVRMEKVIEEIEQKRKEGKPLRPEMKADQPVAQPAQPAGKSPWGKQ